MTTSTTTASHPLPLTFGLEFEHLLAFHTSLLHPHLPTGTRVITSLPYSTRLALRQTTSQYLRTRPTYNSFALTSSTTYTSPFGDGWHNECLAQHGIRGYADEVLRIEQKILGDADVVVHDGKGKMTDFETWYLMNDTSLVGFNREDLTARLLGSNVPASELENWDSAPVELVSRVLSLDSPDSYTEMEMMLSRIRGGGLEQRYKAFISQHCGLHIHIGFPTFSSSDKNFLRLLQHLAYITVIYEPVLSSLHPKERRPGHRDAEQDLMGCREAFYQEPDFSDVDWEGVDVVGEGDSGYASDESEGVLLEFPFPSDQ
ncbi:MAG: hypothetical protein Q9170_003628, partial [Blastenia crenularia]